MSFVIGYCLCILICKDWGIDGMKKVGCKGNAEEEIGYWVHDAED